MKHKRRFVWKDDSEPKSKIIHKGTMGICKFDKCEYRIKNCDHYYCPFKNCIKERRPKQ